MPYVLKKALMEGTVVTPAENPTLTTPVDGGAVASPSLLGGDNVVPFTENMQPEQQPVVEAAPEAETKENTTPQPAIESESKDTVAPAAVEDKENKEGSQSDEPAPLPTYEAFELPEGVTWDEERISGITTLLGEFERSTKADHAEMQKLGQELVNRHVAEVKTAMEGIAKTQKESFEKMKDDWKDSFIKDPEIGGNRQNTTLSAAREFIRTHGGAPEQQKEFIELMNSTGLGNHPAMIRLLSNSMEKMREGSSVPASRPVGAIKNKIEKRYGTS